MKYRAIVELEFEEADLTQRTLKQAKLIEVREISRVCRKCGCTEWAACPGGCSWVERDLCSVCVGKVGARRYGVKKSTREKACVNSSGKGGLRGVAKG